MAANIMLRHCANDFEALFMARAFEESGVEVFAVTTTPTDTKHVVWGKYPSSVSEDEITDRVDKLFDEKYS